MLGLCTFKYLFSSWLFGLEIVISKILGFILFVNIIHHVLNDVKPLVGLAFVEHVVLKQLNTWFSKIRLFYLWTFLLLLVIIHVSIATFIQWLWFLWLTDVTRTFAIHFLCLLLTSLTFIAWKPIKHSLLAWSQCIDTLHKIWNDLITSVF